MQKSKTTCFTFEKTIFFYVKDDTLESKTSCFTIDKTISAPHMRMRPEWLFCFSHFSFNIETGHLNDAVGANGDRFLEMPREFTCTIIGHFDLTLLTLMGVLVYSGTVHPQLATA